MKAEAPIFYSEFDDLAAGAFRLRFSTLIFVLIRSWVDPAGVRYALVWWPPAGFFARFPNLLLVTDLGVGMDSPLDCR